jgi:hypothetical protein
MANQSISKAPLALVGPLHQIFCEALKYDFSPEPTRSCFLICTKEEKPKKIECKILVLSLRNYFTKKKIKMASALPEKPKPRPLIVVLVKTTAHSCFVQNHSSAKESFNVIMCLVVLTLSYKKVQF